MNDRTAHRSPAAPDGRLTEHTPLGDVVTRHPAAARVLESYGLDYCCGGTRPLGEACGAAGVDPAEVLARLGDVDPAPQDWASMDPAELVDHLEATHHRHLHEELPRLSTLADRVLTVHGGRHPELAQVRDTFEELRADLEPHLAKEERVLFPMIRELAHASQRPEFHCGTVRAPVTVMLREHDRAGELLVRLRRLTDGYSPPADGCASYRALYEGLAGLEADTHLHVHKENNVLFPAVLHLESSLPQAG